MKQKVLFCILCLDETAVFKIIYTPNGLTLILLNRVATISIIFLKKKKPLNPYVRLEIKSIKAGFGIYLPLRPTSIALK